jgi:HTH-type transcriptional regulator/antitoxin HigA
VWEDGQQAEAKLTKHEAGEMRKPALTAQKYEKSICTIPAPKTLQGIIELRMYEMKLTQSKLAKQLGVIDVKLSPILNGKRNPDVAFLKAVYEKLHVGAAFFACCTCGIIPGHFDGNNSSCSIRSSLERPNTKWNEVRTLAPRHARTNLQQADKDPWQTQTEGKKL